jgi:hypothetical protein
MGRPYESITALVGCAVGPARSHLGSFIASLIDQQYTANVIYIKVRHAVAFDRWLAKRRVVLADLSEVHIERYRRRRRRRHQCIRAETRRRERREVTHLLQFLRGHGVCPAAHVKTTAADDLAARYAQHLQDHQGLATATIERCRTVARGFLHQRFGEGSVDLRTFVRR